MDKNEIFDRLVDIAGTQANFHSELLGADLVNQENLEVIQSKLSKLILDVGYDVNRESELVERFPYAFEGVA